MQSLATERATDDKSSQVIHLAADIIGARVLEAVRLTRGGNNVTVLLDTNKGAFVAKYYPFAETDVRDRFHAETDALKFMNAQGFTSTPVLMNCDASKRVAVMTACGVPAATVATGADVRACAHFAEQLYAVRRMDSADALQVAAEACLSPGDILKQIRTRRARLESAAEGQPYLSQWLEADFDTAFSTFAEMAIGSLERANIDPESPLPKELLTLSPSDFGLHNALRASDGSLVFVDFEYFGWDDPVRLTCDFLFHPGQQLNDELKANFIQSCTMIFAANDAHFSARLDALYPLVGLRWCMILLNEFLPERLARRRAAGNIASLDDILSEQFEKAQRLLAGLIDRKGL